MGVMAVEDVWIQEPGLSVKVERRRDVARHRTQRRLELAPVPARGQGRTPADRPLLTRQDEPELHRRRRVPLQRDTLALPLGRQLPEAAGAAGRGRCRGRAAKCSAKATTSSAPPPATKCSKVGAGRPRAEQMVAAPGTVVDAFPGLDGRRRLRHQRSRAARCGSPGNRYLWQPRSWRELKAGEAITQTLGMRRL